MHFSRNEKRIFMIDFFPSEHITASKKERFGICDTDQFSTSKAYITEKKGEEWIAVVVNPYRESVNFVPIDHCIDLKRADGKMDPRCDGCLFYQTTLIFVELKAQTIKSNRWINDAEKQLRSTIKHFENESISGRFSTKKAYIANRCKPQIRSGQMQRMQRFFNDTGYVLRIQREIEIQ